MANPVSGENEKNISKCRLLKKKKKKKIKQEGKGLAYSIYKEKPSFFKMSFLTPYKYELLINNIAVSHTHIHAYFFFFFFFLFSIILILYTFISH